jgi:lipopolysaccharide/colanic/teichoic acid biosynthesis glycosyltransferase
VTYALLRKMRSRESAYLLRHPQLYAALKRTLDLCFCAAALPIVLPAIPLIALIIKIDSRGPVLFRQLRLGRNGTPFRIVKFRTMVHNATEIRNPDGSQFVGESDARVTRIGRFLRESSLDELPQLFNILVGHMSVIGPRPDAPGAVDLDTPVLRTKRLVRPGLASLGSVRGRNAISWAARTRWEVHYVTHPSLFLELYIFLKTIAVVVRRQGIYNQPASVQHQSTL